MRFMLLMIPKGYESAEPGTMPDAKAVEAMMQYNESLQQAGVLLTLDGLHPPAAGARVTFNGGTPHVTEGVAPDVKEVLGGYWMIQVNSKEEAIAWATRCPASANETIEIRQVQEFEEFPEDVQQVLDQFPEVSQATTDPGNPPTTHTAPIHSTKINSYLMFNGNCREAFTFYQQCLGGQITMMMTHKEAHSAANITPEWYDKIMHACLDLGGSFGVAQSANRLLIGSDCPPGYFQPPQGFYVQVSVPEPTEAERIFQALAENGTVQMAIAPTFWSARFGMLVDQFGTPWMVNCDQVV